LNLDYSFNLQVLLYLVHCFESGL